MFEYLNSNYYNRFLYCNNKYKTKNQEEIPKLFISPPFGNYSYFNILFPKLVINIRGSFTLEPRQGLISQIVKTLRYSYKYNGWVNKIGLRNPGIDYAIEKYYTKLNESQRKQNIISIAILDNEDINKLKTKIPDDMNLEINISCPNTDKYPIYKGIAIFLNPNRKWCIVKLSPITNLEIVDELYNQGFRQFHCSNTIPIPHGGLSGPSIQPYTSKLVNYISKTYTDCEIIAGGGITSINDINNYKQLGAHYFSISTILFNPIKTVKLFYELCF